MKQAAVGYIQEEQRRIGAKPRLKAEIRPFDVDFGLAPGLGNFLNCFCPASRVIALEPGYVISGSWTGEILQNAGGRMTSVTPTWKNCADYFTWTVWLRSDDRYEEVATLPWRRLEGGVETSVAAYFQIKVTCEDFVRAWAVDNMEEADGYTAYATAAGRDAYDSWAVAGAFPGRLEDLRLTGAITLADTEILDCTPCSAQRPAWFHDLQGAALTLTVDNSRRQWLPGHKNSFLTESFWHGKELHIFSGFELPDGEISWLRQYVGRIQDIRDIGDAWNGRHRAKITCSQLFHERLQQMVGAPAADGTRKPFLAGYYRVRAELKESIAPQVGAVQKMGVGSAELRVTGVFGNAQDLEFLIEAETTGEVSAATFRWSLDGGSSWEKTGVVSATSATPCHLRDGLMIYFVPGGGNDLVAGDRFAFTAYTRRTTYIINGGPFLAITNIYGNGVEMDSVLADATTGEITLLGEVRIVEARVVKSETSNPIDIIKEILNEVGLAENVDEVSFAQARQNVADYQIGARFEGVPAWKAIQAICMSCLIFFWIDGDRIYVSAYTGEG